MKKNIHPNWHNDCKVTCACGNTFTTGSTLEEIKVDICSACHPFFTGEMKFVDTQGRVEKFMQKMKASQGNQQTKKQSKKKEEEHKSYQQLLREQREQIKKAAVAA